MELGLYFVGFGDLLINDGLNECLRVSHLKSSQEALVQHFLDVWNQLLVAHRQR